MKMLNEMNRSVEERKATALMGYLTRYAAELEAKNRDLTAQLETAQQLVVRLVQELGPAAMVHPDPAIRQLARRSDRESEEDQCV